MRYLVREELDLDKPINLRRLSPIMKIYAGIMTRWRGSNTYRHKVEKRREATHMAMVQKDECLKEALLALIFRELDNNTSMAEKGEISKEIVISVNSEYRSSLKRILNHKDFVMYNLELVTENPDMRLAFHTMPILIRVSKKLLKGAE